MAKGRRKSGPGGRKHCPNDMRSMARNPNSPHFKAAQDNRANQLNPQHPAHGRSRAGSGAEDEMVMFPSRPQKDEILDRFAMSMGGGPCFKCMMWKSMKSITLPSILPPPALSWNTCQRCAIKAPSFTIAYGILPGSMVTGPAYEPVGQVPPPRRIALAFCRTTPQDSDSVAALDRAREQNPRVGWRIVDLLPSRAPDFAYWQDWNPPPRYETLDLRTVPWDGREPPYVVWILVPEGDVDHNAIHVYLPTTPFLTTDSFVHLVRHGRMVLEDSFGLYALENLADPGKRHRHLLL